MRMNNQKSYTIALIAVTLIVIFGAYYFMQGKDTHLFASIDAVTIQSDNVILEGEYQLKDTTWSPDASKFYVTENVGITDIGLPEYITYSIYDTNIETLAETEIKDSIVAGTPTWNGNNQLVTDKKIATLAESIQLTDRTLDEPPGYDLLDEVKYCNPNLETCGKRVDGLSFSPNKKYAAFISPYTAYDYSMPYDYRLFVLPQGAQSLDELVWFDKVTMGIEVSEPEFRWSTDSRYLLSGNAELFDMTDKEAIIPFEGYGKRTLLSPDESKVLVVTAQQDRRDQNDYFHQQINVFVKNLSDGSEVQILSTQGDVRETGWVSASFSPDSKYGVYNLNKQLWIFNTETGEKTQLTTESGEYREPRWSTDGNNIIYNTGKEVRLITLTF